MHADTLLPARPFSPVRLNDPLHSALSLGFAMDGLGLIWTLPAHVPPRQRLAFALAVHEAGGLSVLIDADRGFLSVERIVRCTAALTLARMRGAYRTGYAFAQLVEALGYGDHDVRGFELLDAADCAASTAFVAGFGAAVDESFESDVMRVMRGVLVPPVPLVECLRRWTGDHVATALVTGTALQELP